MTLLDAVFTTVGGVYLLYNGFLFTFDGILGTIHWVRRATSPKEYISFKICPNCLKKHDEQHGNGACH